jgi:ADP-heptose:LPS heptosyltransferase
VKLLIDQPINILIEEIQKCNIGIAGTTGQGHIMAAADLPMLVLAGVTNPYQSGPYASRVALLLHRYICGPCYQENFRFGCKKVNCMDTLDISEGVRLANLLADDLEFGKYWMKKSLGSHAIPVEMINTIQLLPMGEWVYKDKNSK